MVISTSVVSMVISISVVSMVISISVVSMVVSVVVSSVVVATSVFLTVVLTSVTSILAVLVDFNVGLKVVGKLDFDVRVGVTLVVKLVVSLVDCEAN